MHVLTSCTLTSTTIAIVYLHTYKTTNIRMGVSIIQAPFMDDSGGDPFVYNLFCYNLPI